MSTTRILGIDPGSRLTGFGIIDVRDGRLEYVTSGCVRTCSAAPLLRLKEIFDGVREIARIYQPHQMAVERVFVHRNVDSALKLGQARGAAICAVLEASLDVHEYSPREIKQAVVGKGGAAKEQVQGMIRAILKLPGEPQADAADALAVAVCHAHTHTTALRLQVAYKKR